MHFARLGRRSLAVISLQGLVTQALLLAQSPPDIARQIAELMARGPSGGTILILFGSQTGNAQVCQSAIVLLHSSQRL